ncbi:MAG: L-threonylcarbamoyladenylate synthase [Verrucomicrobiae bacterium]
MVTRVVGAAEGIPAAAALLAAGEVVALPTETVYGLGAAALDPLACAKIFEAKGRPLTDPLIVHIPTRGWLDRLAEVSETAARLAEHFWPGPLTLVLPRRSLVPDIVTAGQETVAVRMSAHPVFQAVLEAYGKPVAAPSANRFGRISPTLAEDVIEELGGRIPLVLDGGPCAHGVESTIVLVRGGELHILRNGPVTAGELARFGTVRGRVAGISAPGGLASHYAPRTPLVIGFSLAACEPHTGVPPVLAGGRCSVSADFPRSEIWDGTEAVPPEQMAGSCVPAEAGLLAWQSAGGGFARVEHLSKTLDLREAAANLYGAMRRLDAAGLKLIIAEPVPETGLGAAIMERLRKAAAR